MFQKFKNTDHILHYVAYSLSYVSYGMIIGTPGPLIPYLAQITGNIETDYSPFFSMRSFGMVLGVALLKILKSKLRCLTFHRSLTISFLFIGIFSILFSSTIDKTLQEIFLFIASIFYAFIEININLSVAAISEKEDLEFWMLFVTGMYGVGGLVSPLMVYLLQQKAFIALGIIALIFGISYLFLDPPEAIKQQKNESNPQQSQLKQLPHSICYMLAFFLFTHNGIECSFSGWISSYAVITDVATIQQATIFPTIFWIFLTIFRFFASFLPGTTSNKLKYSLMAFLITQSLSILMKYSSLSLVSLYFNSVTSGLTISVLYGLLFAVSPQFGFAPTDSQMFNIIGIGMLGEGVLTMLCGVAMQIHADMFYYSILIMGFMMFLDILLIIRSFKKQSSPLIQQVVIMDLAKNQSKPQTQQVVISQIG